MIDEDNKEDDPDEDERYPHNTASKMQYGRTQIKIENEDLDSSTSSQGIIKQ